KKEGSTKGNKNVTVEGTVIDQTGEPVIGANVVVKGTTNGLLTDIDGHYSLKDVPEDAIISISYIGFQTIELKATSKDLAHITLKE
ncbi:carboxypeptidase-like regulatory domain-containing protein, partial [Acinetobacter baumannii]|nr:carboxypeptidase-like regulatory domain-containing protein [Acinetobacter baumannii]